MLELQNIAKYYQGGTVNETCLFRDFSLAIPDRQFVCVIGSNGSGKTSCSISSAVPSPSMAERCW